MFDRAKHDNSKMKSQKTQNKGNSDKGVYTKNLAEPSRAKKRWAALLGKVVAEKTVNRTLEDEYKHNEGLIDEIKKAKHNRSKIKEGVLSLLQSQENLPEKTFERQKQSTKEIFVRKREKNHPVFTVGGSTFSLPEYDRQARLRYTITPEIRVTLDKIKAKKEKAERKRLEKKPNIFEKLLPSTIIGQILRAIPRFYKLDPLEHVPTLCRRCRRPLAETMEERVTTAGILFLLLFPILGIIFFLANKEFVCVVCEEIYFYGDLTARPQEEYDFAEEDDGPGRK